MCFEDEDFDQEDFDRMLDDYGFKVDIREENGKKVYVLYCDACIADSLEELYHWLIVEFDSK